MSDLDKIYIDPPLISPFPSHNAVEYVRADLVDAKDKRIEELLVVYLEAHARIKELEAVVQKLWRRQDSLNTFDAAVNEVLAPLFDRQTHLGASATTAIFDDLDSLYEGKQNDG